MLQGQGSLKGLKEVRKLCRFRRDSSRQREERGNWKEAYPDHWGWTMMSDLLEIREERTWHQGGMQQDPSIYRLLDHFLKVLFCSIRNRERHWYILSTAIPWFDFSRKVSLLMLQKQLRGEWLIAVTNYLVKRIKNGGFYFDSQFKRGYNSPWWRRHDSRNISIAMNIHTAIPTAIVSHP